MKGYRIDGTKLLIEPTPEGYLKQYWGWYHPATAWEIEEFRNWAAACDSPLKSMQRLAGERFSCSAENRIPTM